MATAKNLPNIRRARYAIKHGAEIGSGSYRSVHKTRRNKWAYKVNLYSGSIRLGSNHHEYLTYLEVTRNVVLPEGVKIPEMHMVGDYLATEYVSGTHPKNNCSRWSHSNKRFTQRDCPGIDKCWFTKVQDIAINDLHHENVIVADDGTIYIIDLGHGSNY